MANNKDVIDETRMDSNLTVNNEGLKMLEIPNNNNEKEENHDPHEAQPEEPASNPLHGDYVQIGCDDDENKVFITTAGLADDPDATSIDQKLVLQEIITDEDGPTFGAVNVAASDLNEIKSIPILINIVQCVKPDPSKSSGLVSRLAKLLPNPSEKEVITILQKIQTEEDKIWSRIDNKYKNIKVTSEMSSEQHRKFRKERDLYILSTNYSMENTPIENALSILNESSYGILFYNKQNEVLAVKNHHGTWSAPKGHRRVMNNGIIETQIEAAIRESLEEVVIKSKGNKRYKLINQKNICSLTSLDKCALYQCHMKFVSREKENMRLIGLFFVSVEKKKFKFELNDKKENQACAWINIDDILRHQPISGYDKYFTLRPFVQYLQDHPTPSQQK